MNTTTAAAKSPWLSPATKRSMRYLWLCGVAVFVFWVWYLGWQGLRDALASIDMRWLPVVIVVDAAGHWLRAYKWQVVLGPKSHAIGLFFLSKGVGYWTPMRAGELAPLMLPGHRTPRMGAWIVVDRVLEIAATLALGALGVLALGLPDLGLYAGLSLVVVILTVGPLYVLLRREWFLWLAERVRPDSVVHRGALFAAAMRPEIAKLRGKLVVASLLTVLAGCVDVWGGIALYLMFGFPLTFALIAAGKCLHALTSAVPLTPNATAVPYMATGALMVQVGGVPSEVVLAAVSVHLVVVNAVFWSSLGLGTLDLRKRS